MPHLTPEQIQGLQRTFIMYVRFPKEMWPEIDKSERFDERGNEVFEQLRKVYLEKYV